ncbi:hypothetical protein, partial [uncultured Faecalibaculum sp.]
RTSNMKGAAVSLHLMVSKRTSATPFHFDSETLEVLSDLNNIRIFKKKQQPVSEAAVGRQGFSSPEYYDSPDPVVFCLSASSMT